MSWPARTADSLRKPFIRPRFSHGGVGEVQGDATRGRSGNKAALELNGRRRSGGHLYGQACVSRYRQIVRAASTAGCSFERSAASLTGLPETAFPSGYRSSSVSRALALEPAMIWIEHDLEMVADLADRIHVLDYGRTLAEFQPGTVLKDPRVITAYIG